MSSVVDGVEGWGFRAGEGGGITVMGTCANEKVCATVSKEAPGEILLTAVGHTQMVVWVQAEGNLLPFMFILV